MVNDDDSQIAPTIEGERVWRAADMADPERWTWRLSTSEIDELLRASAPYADTGEPSLTEINTESFALPSLRRRLESLRQRITHGRGFELLSGFPTGAVSEMQASAAFVGIGAHLGSARSQNAKGDLLGHVRNVGADANDPNVRIYQTDQRQTFHTDSTDVVGLLCLEPAAEGGESMLVSAGAIYNEFSARRPDLAPVLFEPIATDRRGEVPAGADPFFTIPVLSWFDDVLTVLYQRQYIDSAQRFDDAPRQTDRTIAALDLFDEIANDPAFHLRMTLAPGDMQFVHNHSLLHDRTGFIDKPGVPRHLLRLWLSIPDDRRLPDVFAQRYGSTTVGNRGGIHVGLIRGASQTLTE